MTLSRQHSETSVLELVGARCERLLAVPGTTRQAFGHLYLLADGAWYRMFVDAALLFLDECSGPDPDDDLSEGEVYVDLSSDLACGGYAISALTMKNGLLTIAFPHTTLEFREAEGNGCMYIVQSSRPPSM